MLDFLPDKMLERDESRKYTRNRNTILINLKKDKKTTLIFPVPISVCLYKFYTIRFTAFFELLDILKTAGHTGPEANKKAAP